MSTASMNGSTKSPGWGGGGGVPRMSGGCALPHASSSALRSSTSRLVVGAVGHRVADFAVEQEEDVVALGDATVAGERGADGADEAAEQHHAHLVDVEGVVLGERVGVLGGVEQLLELGQLVGIVGELGADLGRQLLTPG